jgi:hypothetical protein
MALKLNSLHAKMNFWALPHRRTEYQSAKRKMKVRQRQDSNLRARKHMISSLIA